MQSKLRSTLLGVCIMTAFAVVSASPALAAERPVVKTLAVTNITAHSATFNGEVNPEGLETKYYFEYGVTSYSEKKTAEFSAGSGTSTLKKSVAVTGLLPNVEYKDVRIVATNSNGKAEGAVVSFKTLPPEFTPAANQSITGEGTEFQMTDYSGAFTCKNETSSGKVTGKYTVGDLVVKFTGCAVTKGEQTSGCPIHSRGAAEGEIVTNALKGQLGAVPTKEAASGVGLLLEGEKEKTWTLLEGSEKEAKLCSIEQTIQGRLALAVSPVGVRQTTGTLTAALTESHNIREVKLASGETVKVLLTSWGGETASMVGTDKVAFGEATEVT